MPLSLRYSPEFAPAEKSMIGMSFERVIPVGVGIRWGTLNILWNIAGPPQPVNADFTVGAIQIRGRVMYCSITGGVPGRDYWLRWTAHDTQGNIWPRSALMLCADTS